MLLLYLVFYNFETQYQQNHCKYYTVSFTHDQLKLISTVDNTKNKTVQKLLRPCISVAILQIDSYRQNNTKSALNHDKYQSAVLKIRIRPVVFTETGHLKFKGSVSRDFRPSFFHDSNLSGSLMNRLKFFRIRFQFCRDIRSQRDLRGVQHTAEIISEVCIVQHCTDEPDFS